MSRGQFKGDQRRSPVTDELDEVFYEKSKRYKYFFLSVSVTVTIICMVLGIVAGLIIMKDTYTSVYYSYLASILNAIQIQIFNYIYNRLAKYLTDLENHRTIIEYEDSLIVKSFAFQFVNSFNSLIYIAFIKPYREGCVEEISGETKSVSCINELYIQLIFIISYAKNLIVIGYPFLKYYYRKRKKATNVSINANSAEKKDLRKKITSEIFKEYYLTREKDGTIDDYMELGIQFGYLTLFALAFPLSSTLAFVGLWFEMITDKTKLLRLVRRPIPLAAKDIGT